MARSSSSASAARKTATKTAKDTAKTAVKLGREIEKTKRGISVLSRETASAVLSEMPIEGLTLDRWWDKQKRDLVTSLERQIRDGISRGETTAELVQRVADSMEIAERQARTLVQTAITHVEVSAAAQTHQDSGLASGYTLDVTFDHRTSPICRKWDSSRVYQFDDPKAPRPPFHFNCRTKIRPALDFSSLGSVGKEAEALFSKTKKKTTGANKGSGDGSKGPRKRDTAPASSSYEDWLKQQPKSFQEDVLGKKRAEWFRDGKVNLAQLVRTDGSQYTIDEMRKKLGLK